MHYPMYTFSENVQLSAADLDLASLGTQAFEEREREREGGGGGLKGSAHFALQILVYIIILDSDLECHLLTFFPTTRRILPYFIDYW